MAKMQTIGELLETMEEKQSQRIEKMIERGLFAMDISDIHWKNFKVYGSSVKKMKIILKAPEYILAIADKIADDNSEVKIAVIEWEDPKVFPPIKVDEAQNLVIISISEKELKKLQYK